MGLFETREAEMRKSHSIKSTPL